MRYSVHRCTKNRPGTRTYGYCLHDSQPANITQEDVEGVGLVRYNPPYRKRPSYVCWFKRKADAVKHCEVMNNRHPDTRLKEILVAVAEEPPAVFQTASHPGWGERRHPLERHDHET